MNKAVNILVTSAGRRVELVSRFKAARNALAPDGRIICCDMDPTAPALQIADEVRILPRIGSCDYAKAVAEAAREAKASLIVPTIDTELLILANEKERIEEISGAKVLISSPDCVAICRDKSETARFLCDNAIPTHKTFSLKELSATDLAFPLFIKPRSGSSSIGAFKVRNRRELDFFLDYVDSPIVQECASGAEFTIDAFLDFDSNIISIVPRRRLAVRAGEILKGKIDLNPQVIFETKRLLELLAPIGPITVQGFLGEDNIFRFTEINPRFGGGAPMSMAAGADSCSWLYLLLAGHTIPPPIIRDGAVFSRFDETIEIKIAGGDK